MNGVDGAQKHPPHYTHDSITLYCVGALSIACVLGLTELLPQWYVSAAFFVYTILDAVWIFIQPAAIPRWASVIFVHHIITALLITHPLRHADHSVFTCLDGLVEVNTFLLIARRQAAPVALANILNTLYWLTLATMRFLLQPALLVWFGKAMSETRLVNGNSLTNGNECQASLSWFDKLVLNEPQLQRFNLVPRFKTWEKALVMGSQLFLLGFNVFLTVQHVSRQSSISHKLSSGKLAAQKNRRKDDARPSRQWMKAE